MLEVTCAVIIHHNKVFAARRPFHKSNGGLWEFPGGKRHDNELLDDCLTRELEEELKVSVEIIEALSPVHHFEAHQPFVLYPFICKMKEQYIDLQEHIEYKWLEVSELQTLEWSPADMPVVEEITKRIKLS
jgi:mutator protein MutT